MTKYPDITFVDEHDNVIGHGALKKALAEGTIYRIVRIFLFNSKGELLIQKRAPNVAFPNKWDQSVGGHVDEDENYLDAAIRELEEEIGVINIPLKELFKFYTEMNNGKFLMKRFNTLFEAVYDGDIEFQESEISEIKWVTIPKLELWMAKNPNDFTDGFLQTYKRYIKTKNQLS